MRAKKRLSIGERLIHGLAAHWLHGRSLTFALVIGLTPVAAVLAQEPGPAGEPLQVRLLVGQDMEVGNAIVTNDAEELCVTYALNADALDAGLLIYGIHLAVEKEFADIPQTRATRWGTAPILGRFVHTPYLEEGVQSHTICIPLDELGVDFDEDVFIVAHAVVMIVDEFGYPSYGEAAWGEGNRFRQRGNWSMWFTYTLRDPVDPVDKMLDYMVIDLSGGPTASSYPVSYMNSVPPGGWADEYKTTKLVMRRIPAGTFTMGSPEDELARIGNETQREVTLTKDYYIGVFPVTQRQWQRVMGDWLSYFDNPTYRASRPVEFVSYYEIRENPLPVISDSYKGSAISPNWPQSSQVHADSFMGKLRARTRLTTLDLPTEAQWEYACRAGTTTALNSGENLTDRQECPNMSEVGRYWYNGGSGHTQGGSTAVATAKVGSYLPNAWGLYDMHGNVFEWCLDWAEWYHPPTTDPLGAASGVYRVRRGGTWNRAAWACRSAYRVTSFGVPWFSPIDTGFRLSMTLP